MSHIVIVGGGAAGMLAALLAAKNGNKVSLYEQNEKLGKKVYITGKGRCNVTNACDAETFFENVMTNPKFLYSSFYSFDNQAVMRLFEESGCALKTERGERVFPVTDHSSDVIRTLEQELKKNYVEIYLNKKIEAVLTKEVEEKKEIEEQKEGNEQKDGNEQKERNEQKELTQQISGIKLSNGEIVKADTVILATGGVSYPLTGADGSGLKIAQTLGHTVTNLKPALVPFTLKDSFYKELQGLALKNVGATLVYQNRVIYTGFGEMLFTHFGISGPLILSASSYYAKKKKNHQDEMQLVLDLKPALTEEQLDKRVLRDFEEHKNKQFKNAIAGLFPIKLIPIMLQKSGIDPEKPVFDISKEERKHFVKMIKHWEMTVTGTRGFNEAIITQGGISVKEINPSTMESKIIKNLFFAGEMIDVDALTGGFNLQIAWSTGYLAGESVNKV